jgi:hypothetical protein
MDNGSVGLFTGGNCRSAWPLVAGDFGRERGLEGKGGRLDIPSFEASVARPRLFEVLGMPRTFEADDEFVLVYSNERVTAISGAPSETRGRKSARPCSFSL